MSNVDSLRNLKLTFTYRVNNGFKEHLRTALKERLVDSIVLYSEYCILPVEQYYPHFVETIEQHDLTTVDLKIEIPLVLNKTKMVKASGCFLSFFCKPMLKTKRIMSIFEDDMQYILKLLLRDINPTGLGAFLKDLSVSSM